MTNPFQNSGFGRLTIDLESRSVEVEGEPRSLPAGVSLTALEGLTVEVRGWVHRRNGPMIDLTHPEQLMMVAGAGGS